MTAFQWRQRKIFIPQHDTCNSKVFSIDTQWQLDSVMQYLLLLVYTVHLHRSVIVAWIKFAVLQ